MGPIQLLSAITRAFVFRVRQLFHLFRAKVRSRGDWKKEWLLIPSEFRGGLARRLVADSLLMGMSRSNLISALTTPEITNPPPSTYPLCWYIGPRRSGAVLMYPYQEYLVVALGSGNIVSSAQIVNFDW
jgi:hypothetical protein